MLGKLFGTMGATAIMTSALGAQLPASRPPIYVVAEPDGPGVRIKVIGASDRELEAHYSLEVTSNSGGGNTRSVQSGDVRLLPGVPVTLVTSALGYVGGGKWTARLSVEPRGGAPYEDLKGSESVETAARQ